MGKIMVSDGDAFSAALDGENQGRPSTWGRSADESGVSASTLTRITQGKRPAVDSLAALSAWSGLDADISVKGRSDKKEPEALPVLSPLRPPIERRGCRCSVDQIVRAEIGSHAEL